MENMVSVIIPAYNCQSTLKKAIDSVLMQNVPLEVIVVDDCSKEDLTSVMEQYREDSRVIYVKNQQNMGVAASRNRGISLAKGEYIAFLDSDDWWSDGKLSAQLARMEKDQTVLCSTGRQLRTFQGEDMGRYIPVKEIVTYKDMLRHNSIACSSVVVKKTVIEEFPMEHDECHEDYITWLLILQKYGRASGINVPYLQYRMSRDSKSGNKLKSAKMTFQVYRHMGYGLLRSCLYFCFYAIHGIRKYAAVKPRGRS